MPSFSSCIVVNAAILLEKIVISESQIMQQDVCFFARTKSSSYIVPLSAKKNYTIVTKKVHEQVTSVGMGAAKSDETR